MRYALTAWTQWYALGMVGRKRTPADAKTQSNPDSHTGQADLNEVVAYNFRAARELRGWTQEETAEALELLLGQRLPQASISAIERAYEGDRRREFDAQEILAFALAFDLPLDMVLPPTARGPPHTAPNDQHRERAIRDRLRRRRPTRAGLRSAPPTRHRRAQ